MENLAENVHETRYVWLHLYLCIYDLMQWGAREEVAVNPLPRGKNFPDSLGTGGGKSRIVRRYENFMIVSENQIE